MEGVLGLQVTALGEPASRPGQFRHREHRRVLVDARTQADRAPFLLPDQPGGIHEQRLPHTGRS